MENITGQIKLILKGYSKTVYGTAQVSGSAMRKRIMKESTLMIKNAAMEFINGGMEIFTKGTFLMIYDMVMEKCIGVMDLITKEYGNLVINMVKEKS